MLAQYLKRGAYNAFGYALASGFTRAVSFFFLPFFLARLSLADFGIWDFYQTLFSIGTLLLCSCTATCLTRFYLMYQDNEELRKQAVGNALLATVIGLITFVIVIAPIAFIYSGQQSVHYLYFVSIIISICLFALFSLVLAYHRVKENLITYFVLYCVQNLLSTGLTVVGIYFNYGIEAFFCAQLCSLLLFMPLFFSLFFSYFSFSFSLLKEQLAYSVPLFIYSLIYSGFFTVDRFFIQHNAGYETLGMYSLLWRFGTIFQFVAIALSDAWPLVLFNAQKEKDSDLLIRKLTTYFCITLATMCLGIIVASRCAIGWLFPAKYYVLLEYIIPFFTFVLLLEVVKIVQAGFGLSAKTIYTPVLVSCSLLLQAVLLFWMHASSLLVILLINNGVLIVYTLTAYYVASRVYPSAIFNIQRLLTLALCLGVYLCFVNLLLVYNQPWYYFCMLLASWPITLWLIGVIDEQAKETIRNFFAGPASDTGQKTILYLRTDISCDEIKAGGSVAHTVGVINGFQQCGYQVMCASSAIQSVVEKLNLHYFTRLKVVPLFVFLRWKLYPLRWRLENLFSNLFFSLQILAVLYNKKIAFVYQRYSLLNCTGLFISRIKKVPLILEYNGSEVWLFEKWTESRLFKLHWLCKKIEMLNIHKADCITVVSQVLKEELIKEGVSASKIVVSPNGVDPEIFNPHKLELARATIRKELNIEQSFVVGFIGTFSYWHGVDVLSSIIPTIIAQAPHVHFLLIGDGILLPLIKKQLAEKSIDQKHVTFTGLVPQHEAKNYLAACDAYICPTQPNVDGSRFFGSPTKLFEYMSMGKPIIASNLEQLTEIVCPAVTVQQLQKCDESTGILVNPHDIQGFIQAVIYVSKAHNNVIEKMGERARKKAIECYSWDKHVQKIINFEREMHGQ